MAARRETNFATILAAARGLALFIAILWHVDISMDVFFPGYKVHEVTFKVLWFFPLPTFFLFLGLSFSNIIAREKIGIISNSVSYYLYLYAIWALLYHILFAVFGREVHEFGLVPALKHFLFPAPELWFVGWMAFCLFICTATRNMLKLSCLLISIAWILLLDSPGYSIKNFMIYNLIFVYIGIIFRERIIRIFELPSGPVITFCLPLYGLIAYFNIPHIAFSMPLPSIAASLIGITLAIHILKACRNYSGPRMLADVGRRAFHLYLVAPGWIFTDCKLIQTINAHWLALTPDQIGSLTLPVCLLVMGQSLMTISLLGSKSFLLKAPSIIQTRASRAVARLLVLCSWSKSSLVNSSPLVERSNDVN